MKGKTWGVMVVMVVAVVGMWEVKMCGAVSGADCKEERRVAINACKPILYGKDPTPACCERIRVTHIECVCPVITPKLAALVDVNRMVRLIEGCGRNVPRHYKCGSMLSLSLSPVSLCMSVSNTQRHDAHYWSNAYANRAFFLILQV